MTLIARGGGTASFSGACGRKDIVENPTPRVAPKKKLVSKFTYQLKKWYFVKSCYTASEVELQEIYF